jgi:hypothetical protein
MIHAILTGLFTREQVQRHVDVIRHHLLAADGARLFDRPLPYRGGVQHHFQRAETGTFFGREIGLMYTHAHLRYAEAMAHLGEAEAFFQALRQANPVALQSVVPNARPRQVNCYTSSSDAAASALRRGEDRRRRGGGRLARVLEWGRDRGAARARIPARLAPEQRGGRHRPGTRARSSTACARVVESPANGRETLSRDSRFRPRRCS